MYRNPNPYIPKTKDEIRDFLGRMMLGAPTFIDKTGYFETRNIETEFLALNEGLELVRRQLGEENYRKLTELSAQMRKLFEADPENKTGETSKGRKCILEMQEVLHGVSRRKR